MVIGNYTDLGDSKQLASWITENFKDVDTEDIENEQKALLQDSILGATEEDRKKSLVIAKQVAIGYGVGGWLCFGLTFFYDSKWSLILNLIYPLLAGIVMLWSKGLIKFFASPKRSIYPSLFYGFMPTAIALIALSAAKYTFFEFDTLWLPAILISLIVFAMLYFADRIRIIEPLKGKIFLISFMALAYGFGSIMQVNCAFDDSPTKIYNATVLDHRIESGKHTSYLFTLSPWGPMHKEREEDVGRWIYDNVSIGDSVRVYFHKGKLNAPWYQVHSFAYQGK